MGDLMYQPRKYRYTLKKKLREAEKRQSAQSSFALPIFTKFVRLIYKTVTCYRRLDSQYISFVCCVRI